MKTLSYWEKRTFNSDEYSLALERVRQLTGEELDEFEGLIEEISDYEEKHYNF